jgi:hypothetical protein
MGEIAPNGAYANHIALHNPDPGNYHFYIDNVVIRRKDGTIRGVVYSDSSDTDSKSYSGDGYSSIVFNNVSLDVLPVPDESNYNDWAESVGDFADSDPSEAGPTNEWSILMEYALGSDPNTPTAGLQPGTNAPTSGQLGTYAFREVFNTNHMTLTFDFNRDARDVEIVVVESTNLIDWVDAVVLTPPYSDTGVILTNGLVIEVADNAGGGYPVDTTRVTAPGSDALEAAGKGFLKLEVRATVAVPDAPIDLYADVYDGILLEWGGSLESGVYIIDRAVSGSGSYAELARTGSANYTDTSAVVSITYDYRVRAVNAAGSTPWSDVVTIQR